MEQKKSKSAAGPTTSDLKRGDILKAGGRDAEDASHTIPISRRVILDNINVQQQACLDISVNGTRVLNITLKEGEMHVGRSSECEIHLPFENISRKHARMYYRNEEYHIQDLGSTNGTFVNGIRVSDCVLRNNDVIEIGEARISFVEERTRKSE